MTKVKISVTQEHINYGRRGSCHDCPIALAVCAALRAGRVRVTPGFIDYKRYLDIPLPAEAQLFITRFDAEVSVKPFEFELEIPEFLDNHETIPKI